MKQPSKIKNSVKRPVKASRSALFRVLEKSDYLYYKVLCTVLLIITACYFTFIHNSDFLFKLQELSLFIFDGIFFRECMQVAGGLLIYAGAFLTQFFYYPVIGSLIYISLLLTIVWLVVKAFHIPSKFFPLALIPASLFLLTVTGLDYIIFVIKSNGYLFSNMLGTILLLASFMVYRRIPNYWARTGFLFLLVVAGYPLFGFYALLTSLLCTIYELGLFSRDRKSLHFIPCLSATVTAIAAPLFYFAFIYSRMSSIDMYTSGLPLFFFNKVEFAFWAPYITIFISLVLFAGFLFKQPETDRFGFSSAMVFVLYLISIAGVYGGSFENKNFRAEIAMDIAVFNNDWEKVIKISEANESEPSRLTVMFRNLALQKMKVAGDNMFRYPHASAPMQARRPSQYLRDAGAKPIYYQYGQINSCYRWAMEDNVEYGTKVVHLKYMVKCALLNDEIKLAEKYNNAIKKTLFHRSWAEKYQQYIDNPAQMDNDAEFAAIRPLMAYDNMLAGDAGLLENYILNSFAHMEGGNREIAELSLQNNLIQKNIERFWPRFFLYVRNHDRIPVHYQEAALLYSYLEGKVDISGIPFDPEVEAAFGRFVEMSKQFGSYSEDKTQKIFKEKFGKTFWYYYFFTKDLKTN